MFSVSSKMFLENNDGLKRMMDDIKQMLYAGTFIQTSFNIFMSLPMAQPGQTNLYIGFASHNNKV